MAKYLVYNNVQGKSTARPIVKMFECDPTELADQTALLAANEVAVATTDAFDLDGLTETIAFPAGIGSDDRQFVAFTVATSQAGLSTVTLNLGADLLLMNDALKGFRLFRLSILEGGEITGNTADTVTLNAPVASSSLTSWAIGCGLFWSVGVGGSYSWEGLFRKIPTYDTVTPGVNATLKILTVSPTLDQLNAGFYLSFMEAQAKQLEERLHMFSQFSTTELSDLLTLWNGWQADITAWAGGLTEYPPIPLNAVLEEPTETSAFALIERLWRREHTIGTVSLVAGIPTGTLCESGSNANGEYFRFTDGTQICWLNSLTLGAANIAAGSIFVTADATWTYPAAFASIGALSGNVNSGNCWLGRGSGAVGATTAVVIGMRHASSATSLTARVMAVGRWN